jgi:signal transduction histidine kinase
MGTPRLMKTWIKRSPFRGLSIQQRLPLLICVLLLCVVVAFSWVSYLGVKNTALRAGRERLNSLGDQLSSVLSQSAHIFITATRASAMEAPLKQYLQSQDSAYYKEAFDLLQKQRQDTMTVAVDLLNSKKQRVMRSVKPALASRVNFDSLLSSTSASDTGTLARMQLAGDSAYYPVIVSVRDHNKLIGYLVRWRIVTGNPKAIEQFSQLMGGDALLFVGNADGTVWTNMIKPIPDPLGQHVKQTEKTLEYSHGNNRYLATRRPILGTQWTILIEFSQNNVLQSASSFLKWVIVIGSILVFIGIFIAWIMSRNITTPLNKLTAAVSDIASGKEVPAVAIDRRDEVGKLARAFNAMTIQVRNAKQDLEQKIIESEQMNEQLRDLSAHLQNIREEERIHIAREMHDELGQLLTGFKMDVAWLDKRLTTVDDPAVKEKLESLMHIVDEAVSFVRKLSAELRPSILDDLGLVPALEWHSKEFQKRFDIKVDFHSRAQELETSGLIATGLFRMYQESLTNVARHSGAKTVVANLQRTPAQICLSITDDGKGFAINGTREKKTLGLLGMKERAVMIGGRLEILSEPGKGTTVIITVPVNGSVN